MKEAIDAKYGKYVDAYVRRVQNCYATFKRKFPNYPHNAETDKKMVDYFEINIKNCEKDDSYGNQKLLQNIFDSPISKEVLASYQIEFSKIINLINKLMENLLKDLYLLPYSVKCICKIIFLLITKKFNNI